MAETEKILVLDDDEPSARLLGRFLGALGHSTEVVTTGEEALEALQEHPEAYVMVMLDLAMPDMNGFEVCRAIRADERLSALPVVAITANVDMEYLQESDEAGINRIITKPFGRHEIEDALKDFLGTN